MRDLGDARQPVVGVDHFDKVGDVGELPYAVDPEPTVSDRDLRPILIGIVVLIAIVAILVAFLV
ncbi:MAG: hypothetical protein KDB02_15755 [Acidimicrobiales bacterium]|nr:hypothetical protein [Acidimicrobiales bacterium]